MRVDVVPIIDAARELAEAISLKAVSRGRSAAHKLITALPDPSWADTAPGCSVYYNQEYEVAPEIEVLRSAAVTWYKALLALDADFPPDSAWPLPNKLTDATQNLAVFVPSECVNLKEDGPVAVEV